MSTVFCGSFNSELKLSMFVKVDNFSTSSVVSLSDLFPSVFIFTLLFGVEFFFIPTYLTIPNVQAATITNIVITLNIYFFLLFTIYFSLH